ncbi:MAG: ribonuclease ribonuclease [Candidatus Parcubacteria bacterium]|jgi:ribonuclease HII
MKYIVGIDEVGRGPIAGPVTVCAFIMHADADVLMHFKNRKIKDSKKLSDNERRRVRSELNKQKLAGSVDFAIASRSAEYIDEYGISHAVQKCIQQALSTLLRLNYVLDSTSTTICLDGALTIDQAYIDRILKKYKQSIEYSVHTKGDENIPAIACASIMAKITRDNYMHYLHKKLYDSEGKWYAFDTNVGYGTREHYEYIEKYGITAHHRRSYLKKIQN